MLVTVIHSEPALSPKMAIRLALPADVARVIISAQPRTCQFHHARQAWRLDVIVEMLLVQVVIGPLEPLWSSFEQPLPGSPRRSYSVDSLCYLSLVTGRPLA